MGTFLLIGGLKSATSTLMANSFRCTANAVYSTKAEASGNVSWENARPFEEIPGPKPLPIIGNLYQFIPVIGKLGSLDLLQQQKYLFKTYGKISKLVGIPGRRDKVYVFEPKWFEEMYRNEGIYPYRDVAQSLAYYRKVYRKEFFQGVGGLLVEQGEEWKTFRTKVNPPMMQPRIVKRYIKPIVEVANDFIERTKSLRDSKGEMPDDYSNELNKWALESITMIALDTRLGCLEPNLKPDSEPQKMINAVDAFFNGVEILELRVPFWKIMNTPSLRRYCKVLDYFTDVSMKYINGAIKRMKERKADTDYEPSVLEKILQRDPNPKIACVMALDMLSGGVDTTALNMACVLYHLSKNQSKQQHLFEELLRFLPNKNDDLTADMIEEMKYLKACLKESMRLTGMVTGIMRGTVKDTVIGNYRIPKNVNVFMLHLLAGHMEENYPLADKFIPERWLKSRPEEAETAGSAEDFDKVKGFNTHPFVFMPFGFGPRMCVGRRFAMLELEVLLAKMIRNFQVEYNYGEMGFVFKLLNKPMKPLKYKMTERST